MNHPERAFAMTVVRRRLGGDEEHELATGARLVLGASGAGVQTKKKDDDGENRAKGHGSPPCGSSGAEDTPVAGQSNYVGENRAGTGLRRVSGSGEDVAGTARTGDTDRRRRARVVHHADPE